MFWTNDTASAPAGHYLKEQLRARLRVAADFATLGAYELTGDEAAEPVHAEREVPQRVFLFAKVAAPCPASRAEDRPRCARRSARARPARRRGGVRAPEQPCICATTAKRPA